MEIFLGLHTQMEHDFKDLVAKIAIGGFCTSNASAKGTRQYFRIR